MNREDPARRHVTPLLSVLVVVGLVATLAACSGKPRPPTLVVQRAVVTRVAGDELDLRLDAEGSNPNSLPVAMRSVTVEVHIRQGIALGTATATSPADIPPHASVSLPVSVSLFPSSFADTLVTLARGGTDVDLVIAGTASLGGPDVAVSLPFEAAATLTHAQIVGAAPRSCCPDAGSTPIDVPSPPDASPRGCRPDSRRCAGMYVQTCDSGGHWRSQRSCSKSESCVSGACVPSWPAPASQPPY
jgi:LEA14-like dessication related protein